MPSDSGMPTSTPEDEPAVRISADVAAIINAVTDMKIPFLARKIAGDPEGEIRTTRRVTQTDLDSERFRRAQARYVVAKAYVRLLVANELYPDRFEHPGPFETPERLAQIQEVYNERFRRRHIGFAARMAGF